MTRRDVMLSLDPGDPHVGLALWVYDRNLSRWRCQRAREMLPDQYADLIYRDVPAGKVGRIAYEVFRLGGGQEALFQKGSDFPMVELIGLTRHFARWHDVELVPVQRDRRSSALKRMKAVGYRFPRGASTHVKDAVAVGAVALGWTAADHHDGDGVADPEWRAKPVESDQPTTGSASG